MTDIFDGNGRIRADINIESIPPDRRAAFTALATAQAQCDRAEADEQAANKRVEECVRVYNEAESRVPKASFLDEWQRAVGQAVTTKTPPSYAVMRRAEQAHMDALQVSRECRTAAIQARTAFGVALGAWNAGAVVTTPLEAAREFIWTSQMERAAKAAAGQLPYRPNITQTAKYTGDGGRNVKRGGGRSFSRGAFTKTEALTAEANRLRQAAKVPRG